MRSHRPRACGESAGIICTPSWRMVRTIACVSPRQAPRAASGMARRAWIARWATPAPSVRAPASPSSTSRHARVRHPGFPNSTRSRARCRHRQALAPISAGGGVPQHLPPQDGPGQDGTGRDRDGGLRTANSRRRSQPPQRGSGASASPPGFGSPESRQNRVARIPGGRGAVGNRRCHRTLTPGSRRARSGPETHPKEQER